MPKVSASVVTVVPRVTTGVAATGAVVDTLCTPPCAVLVAVVLLPAVEVVAVPFVV